MNTAVTVFVEIILTLVLAPMGFLSIPSYMDHYSTPGVRERAEQWRKDARIQAVFTLLLGAVLVFLTIKFGWSISRFFAWYDGRSVE